MRVYRGAFARLDALPGRAKRRADGNGMEWLPTAVLLAPWEALCEAAGLAVAGGAQGRRPRAPRPPAVNSNKALDQIQHGLVHPAGGGERRYAVRQDFSRFF